ncbi:MAG TPA: tRNA (N6-threonylcarbamoyladenosine(37)-N6)-methyltransferase TrmO [Candidatus Competibacteraceae bacterium]|nr:tRNA (N6-threonylcarbamoyladenosine(37)-N6)-methyltransferase TrmO [Candidatus Competibacteraceae bacterium]
MQFIFQPIGLVRSCFLDKFGVPRQPGLAPAARGELWLLPPYDRREAFVGLEAFSHLWLIFVFHHIPARAWQPTVRPPRLGGNRRLGVFATRSTHRPNPIGLSVVRFEGIVDDDQGLRLRLAGVDLVDGTPVLDIKPYVPYADSLLEASGGFAETAPEPLPVRFSEQAEAQCRDYEARSGRELRLLIEQVLALDPRPAYQRDPERLYGVRLWELDVRWRVVVEAGSEEVRVEAIVPA